MYSNTLPLSTSASKKTGERSEGVENDFFSIEKVLKTSSKEIQSILNVITEIANQSKMLSMNASIIAAKSDYGDNGFEVIAQEISKLSESSKASALDIEKVLDKMEKDIQSSYSHMDRLKSEKVDKLKLESKLSSINAQNELFGQILNEIDHKVSLKDAKGKIYLVNGNVADDYGLKPEEIIGKTDFDFFEYGYAKKLEEIEREIVNNRKPIISLEKVTLNNEIKHWLIRKIPIFIPEHNDWGLLGIQSRIDDTKVRDERFLMELRKKYPSIVFKT